MITSGNYLNIFQIKQEYLKYINGRMAAAIAEQGVIQQGIEWEVGQNVFVSTILGDVNWTDYEIHADVNIQEIPAMLNY